MKLGLIIPLSNTVNEEFKKVQELGLETCQLNSWDLNAYNMKAANLIKHSINETGIEVSALWAGWPGPAAWDLVNGPITLGLVPTVYQYARVEALKKASDFAREAGINTITTHVGFIPDNPNDPLYADLLIALKTITRYCKNNNQSFNFETGQETPVTLLRTIEDLSIDNLGINLDPANLIMYGKANPVDALDVFGSYVKDVHAKDGFYPTEGRKLGKEARLGDGKVNYPAFVKKLVSIGYDGPLTIEREIAGEKQIEDIKYARKYLESLI